MPPFGPRGRPGYRGRYYNYGYPYRWSRYGYYNYPYLFPYYYENPTYVPEVVIQTPAPAPVAEPAPIAAPPAPVQQDNNMLYGLLGLGLLFMYYQQK